jgi:catechol 2,3-dioxygenase-like lactoylglutathione lyase family enzyme
MPFLRRLWPHKENNAMSDFATPNLPSRDFAATEKFYSALGFITGWRDNGWMILTRGALKLEFFPHPELDPKTSWFSCCLRLDDLDSFYAVCKAAGIAEKNNGHPRLRPPKMEDWGGRMGALIDPDGTLVRLIQN